MNSEIWTLIGVTIGAILGFVLNFLRDEIKESKQRKRYLMDLLGDLEYNQKLAERGESWGYHTVAYRDAKGAKYLFNLPEPLRSQIYDVQCITSGVYVKRKGLSSEETKRLKELLDSIIPQFKKHVDC